MAICPNGTQARALSAAEGLVVDSPQERGIPELQIRNPKRCPSDTLSFLSPKYDFVDVRDIATAEIAAAPKGRTGERIDQLNQTLMMQEVSRVHGRLYGIPVWQLSMMAGIAWAWNWARDTVPGFTLDEARIVKSNSFISHEKATREMGFQPRPMKETAADSIAWLRQNGNL